MVETMKFNFDYEDYQPRNICNIAVAVLGAAVVGGVATAYSAHQASNAQTAASERASQTALDMYGRTREDLSPFRQIGIDASEELKQRLPFLTSPITMDQATLEGTPGYQFTRTQGLKAVQNSAAARGLGVSGAAQKGAATFATGLADQTYQNQFNLENTNRTNAYNRLLELTKVGGNAAAQTGNAGTAAAGVAAGAQIGAGNAQAAGANAIGSSVARVAGDVGGYAMYKGLYGDTGPQTGGVTGFGQDRGRYDF